MAISQSTLLKGVQDAGTIVIADTADFQQISRFSPSEGTTNPSLLYTAAQQPAYASLIKSTIAYAKSLDVADSARPEHAVEYLAVLFGSEIYRLTSRVSTEVDVVHSFDTTKTVEAALRILALYKAQGVPKEAVRIKISATWEGIQAGRILQKEHGVSVLLTIVFGMVQAITAAEAEVDCIAPYVGRMSDWYKAQGVTDRDMGVETVTKIQNYLRKHGYKTKVMGASFRNTQQVKDLAGVDLLTISPAILEQLLNTNGEVVPKLTNESAITADLPKVSYINDENAFRWAFNGDACAVEKSADAMRRFADDTEKLKALLAGLLD